MSAVAHQFQLASHHMLVHFNERLLVLDDCSWHPAAAVAGLEPVVTALSCRHCTYGPDCIKTLAAILSAAASTATLLLLTRLQTPTYTALPLGVILKRLSSISPWATITSLRS